MKKILTILAILMVTLTEGYASFDYNGYDYCRSRESNKIRVERSNMSGGELSTTNAGGAQYELLLDADYPEHLVHMVVQADQKDGIVLSDDGRLHIKYTNDCMIKFYTDNGAWFDSPYYATNIAFADVEHSLSNVSNGFSAANSTSGIVVDGANSRSDNTKSMTEIFACAATGTDSHELILTGLGVQYVRMVYHASDYISLLDAMNTTDCYGNRTSYIYLDCDIDLTQGGRYKTIERYVFSRVFCGVISGENESGTDYKLTSSGTYIGSHFINRVDGATFKHLIFENFFDQCDAGFLGGSMSNIVRVSYNSTYDHVTLRNCRLSYEDGNESYFMANFISESHNDKLSNVTVESDCSIKGHVDGSTDADANCAGIVAKAWGTTFTQCHNAGTVWANENQVAGIVAYANSCTLDRCLNTGRITGQSNVGGIVGNAASGTVIKRCVNTGVVDDDQGKSEDKHGGIAGLIQGSKTTVTQCLNFGEVTKGDNKYGEMIGGREGSAPDWREANLHNFYYCDYNGKHNDNESMYSSSGSIYRHSKMCSGEFAFKSTIDEAEGADNWLYQDIDNDTLDTHYPVPIAVAGTVYSNILCDGTQSYSNKYQSAGAHESQLDADGKCTVCGVYAKHISTADELVDFANSVNSNFNYSGQVICLDNDIDLSGSSFTRIGDTTHPFKGIFNGQGHRIKNLTVTFTDGGCHGFFGCVAGENTIIKNLVIDSSCSITSNGDYSGTAGLIGCVQSTSGSTCNVTIENCGNEATVTGEDNVAGIVGGVYDNTNTWLRIVNCYNTGTINGSTKSATLCAIANCKYDFINCYNSGSLTGVKDNNYFYRTEKSDIKNVINCYDVNGSMTGVQELPVNMISSGELCYLLNGSGNVFTQNVGVDAFPVPGTDGVTGIKQVHIATADELVAFAQDVNNGTNYTGKIVDLTSDIDLCGKDFPVIGRYYTAPFRGTFDGNGHRIKNMKLSFAEGGIGLFGVVSGIGSIIRNVIIDSSCSVTSSSGGGIAGVVGSIKPFSGIASNVTIENCGNEAAITGNYNVAGILGGVYENDDNVVTITNCYNAGAIKATSSSDKNSASICGYARDNYVISNCYNCGSLTGAESSHPLYVPGSTSSTSSVAGCYDVNGGQTGVTYITQYPVESGDLCNKLNVDGNIFTQTVGTDAHPILGTDGLTGDPTEYWKEPSTPEEFKEAMEMTYANCDYTVKVRLADDIDLSSLSAISSGDNKGYLFQTNYNGIIDGNGHTLKNSTHALFYSTCGATIKNITLDGFAVTDQPSLIARTSYRSTFDNITAQNSSIVHTSDNMNNFGMIVGYSCEDTLSYCTVEPGCYITTNRQKIGGLAGEMYGGVISFCQNSATITGDADYIGGIVGLTGKSGTGNAATIKSCLNTGTINGDDICGGIAGYYYNGTISHCVNTGAISSKDGDNHDNVGGLVGKLLTAECDTCINFGNVTTAKSTKAQFAIYGGSEGTVTEKDNAYYCSVHGTHLDSGLSSEDVLSGKYAYTKDWLYQDFDNFVFTATDYPVPLPKAGTVYSNILCHGQQSYSNKYQSTAAHETVLDVYGKCSICGYPWSRTEVHIKNAAYLCDFAEAVNSGADYSNYTVYLDNDIDMSSVDEFTPIGSTTYPFYGTFDGQGHRIKNLTITGESYTGLFGLVGGDNKTVNIKNVIIDSSCSNTSTGTGVAGLIGCVTSTSGQTCNVTIENCGNEAAITSDRNVGGIMGAVFNNDNTVVTISNCYNTGFITGRTLVSALGYVRKNYTITNCYNSGRLTATKNTPSLYRTDSTGGVTSIENCYDIIGTQTGVTQITADQVASGELCFLLNGNKAEGTWGHTCDDAYPVLSGAGMQHYSRTMSNQWGTICLPFDAEMGDEYDFYKLSGVSDDAITLTKVETLAAGTPAIVRRNTTATGIDVPASGTDYAAAPITGSSANGLTLTGAFTKTAITTGYIISNNAFWNIANLNATKVYCDAFRAYLAGTITSGAKMLGIAIGGESATGIDALNAITSGEAEYYNLSGHKLNDLQKGINIVKFSKGVTKKVIIR